MRIFLGTLLKPLEWFESAVSRLVSASHFPAVDDVEKERSKMDIFRIIAASIVFWRVAWIVYAGFYYYDSPPWGPEFHLLPQLRFGCWELLLLLMLLFGFLTPAALVLLIYSYQRFDFLMNTATLGSSVLGLVFLVLLAGNAGMRYSVDGLLIKRWPKLIPIRFIKLLYQLIGTRTARQYRILYFVMFVSYSFMHLGAAMFHLHDQYWLEGRTMQVMFTNSDLSSHYQFFRAWDIYWPESLHYLSWAGTRLQIFWQILMVPLCYFKIGMYFVIGWGLQFFIWSIVCLQLSYLSHLEFVLWAIFFLRPYQRVELKVIYDDQCNLCQSTIKILRFFDWFRLAPLEFHGLSRSKSLLHQYRIRKEDVAEDIHAIAEGRVYRGYPFYEFMSRRNPFFIVFYPFLFLGRVFRVGPYFYRVVARNRAKLFGVCKVPDQSDHLDQGRVELQEARDWNQHFIFRGALLLWMSIILLFTTRFPGIDQRAKQVGLLGVKRSMDQLAVKVPFYSLGLQVPNVFNYVDLKSGDHWPVIYRVDVQDSTRRERVPFNDINGGRDWYFVSDLFLYGSSVPWRRHMIGRDLRVHARQDTLVFQLIARIAQFDYRFNGFKEPVTYQIELYQNKASSIKGGGGSIYRHSCTIINSL